MFCATYLFYVLCYLSILCSVLGARTSQEGLRAFWVFAEREQQPHRAVRLRKPATAPWARRQNAAFGKHGARPTLAWRKWDPYPNPYPIA